MQLERHPLNREFRWIERPGALRRISPAQKRAYDEVGFFLLDEAFDADTVRRVIDAIDPFEARAVEFLRAQPNEKFFIADAKTITFTVHLAALSPFLRQFVSGPVFCDLAHDLIGPDVRLYWDQAVYKKFEQPRPFPWHQDNGYTYIEPQQYLTCWVALTDATEENGCPWVVPGVHRHGTLKHRMTDLGWQCLDDPPNAVPVPARAGSIAVFSSLTPHCTGPNRTADVRKSYIVQFAPDGAHTVSRDPNSGELRTEPQNNPERQFFVLRSGVPER
jgi:ectoine hydroxylase-related dioxygenase (phytanoyl-CoA dioxygenase family)